MSTPYKDPPLMPEPVDREELGRNQSAFLHYWNTFFQKNYDFTKWLVGFIPWISQLKNDVTSYLNSTLNAKTKAESASERAVSAKNEIEGYVIPNGTAYSLEQMEEFAEAVIWADAENFKLIQE